MPIPQTQSPPIARTSYDPEFQKIKGKKVEIERLLRGAGIAGKVTVGDLATSTSAPAKLGVIREANTAKLNKAQAVAKKEWDALEYAKTHKGSPQQISALKNAYNTAAAEVTKLEVQDAKLEVLRGLIAELVQEQEVVAGVAPSGAGTTAVAAPGPAVTAATPVTVAKKTAYEEWKEQPFGIGYEEMLKDIWRTSVEEALARREQLRQLLAAGGLSEDKEKRARGKLSAIDAYLIDKDIPVPVKPSGVVVAEPAKPSPPSGPKYDKLLADLAKAEAAWKIAAANLSDANKMLKAKFPVRGYPQVVDDEAKAYARVEDLKTQLAGW